MIEFGLDSGLKIPPKSQVGNLSAELANEGIHVSEGAPESWTPPKKQDMYPDWSQFKSIQKYFGRKGFQPWPAWIYHPTETAKIVKDADEAFAHGIVYREPTEDEKFRGIGASYDFIGEQKWRTRPWKDPKFDPLNPDTGKIYESPRPDYQRSQHDMMRNLVEALREGGVKGGNGLDPEAIAAIVAATVKAMNPAPVEPVHAAPIEVEAADQERDAWIREAEDRGVKIDKRWGVERIKAEIEKNG